LTKNEAGFGNKGFLGLRKQLEENNIESYSTVPEKELEQLDEYMRHFGYYFDTSNNFNSGWIYQVRESIQPGNFIFTNAAFSKSLKDLKNLDVGKLYEDENYHWDKGGFLSDTYQTFVKSLTKLEMDDGAHLVNHTKEKFIAHLHDGIMASQSKR
jgi:hypothetical protein